MKYRISVGLVLGQKWTAAYQQDWYWASIFLKCISCTVTEAVVYCIVSIRLVVVNITRTGTRPVVDCDVSTELTLGQYCIY